MGLWEGGGKDSSFSRYRNKCRLGCSSQQIAVLHSWRWLNSLLNLEGRSTGQCTDPKAQRTGSADIQESQLRTGPCDFVEHLLGLCAVGGPIKGSYFRLVQDCRTQSILSGSPAGGYSQTLLLTAAAQMCWHEGFLSSFKAWHAVCLGRTWEVRHVPCTVRALCPSLSWSLQVGLRLLAGTALKETCWSGRRVLMLKMPQDNM